MPTEQPPTHAARRRAARVTAATAAVGLILALVPGLGLSAAGAPAASAPDDSVWSPVSERVPERLRGKPRRVDPTSFEAFTLDDAALARVLADAPAEDATAGSRATADARPARLEVPAPTGELVAFDVVESPIMEPGLAAAHPEISTYAGRAVDDPTATIRLDVTPAGFHAAVRGPGGKAAWYVDPAFTGDDSVYLSYRGSDLPREDRALVEPEPIAPADLERLLELDADEKAGATAAEQPGEAVTLRTYRLALVTDQTYARYFGTENVLAEKVTLMNRVNQIYNDDLAIRMVLIDETDTLNLDTDAEAVLPNGPCGSASCFTPTQLTNGCTGSLLRQNRVVLGQLVGASSYDIGHIMLGLSGGGVASLGVVGGNSKAQGCTGLPTPEGDFMAVDYVSHEMGHQFAGNHTFNGTQWNCSGGNRSQANSVEPGSGSSVMAYAGICQQDNLQPHSDPYFSQRSIQEISTYVTSSRAAIDEVQTVSLRGFDADGEAFTLSFGGATSAPIVRGTTYTVEAIDAELEALTGAAVTVAAWGGSGTLTDAGFQATFGGALAGQNLDAIGITPAAGDVTGFVGETAKGGPIDNGGHSLESFGNHAPSVTAPATVTIPLRTPFALTAEGSDVDGDPLVYLWEQNDRGAQAGTALMSQTKSNGPLFRVFGKHAPVTPAGTLLYHSPGENLADGNPTRVFPDLEQVLANNTNAATGQCPTPPPPPASGGATNVPLDIVECFAEWLPTADYVGAEQAGNTEPSLNFRVTVRDLHPLSGGTALADTKVLIDTTAGPFAVSSKNTPAGAVGGRTEVVAWAVAGTNKPELAENVRITLSTDGGATFPHVLAESTPNDGSEPVTWPRIATPDARIKIEAAGGVFFDVNNADFEIVLPDDTAPETTLTSGPADGAYVVADEVTFGFASSEPGTFSCTLDGAPAACSGSSVTLDGLSAGTHTFSVGAVDNSANADPTPVVRTFTVPIDDDDLTRTGTWSTVADAQAFGGSYSLARQGGATIGTPITDATGVALVVATAKGDGKVDVRLNGRWIASVSLDSKRPESGKVLVVADWGTTRSGELTVVTGNKKPVRIDGIAVRTS